MPKPAAVILAGGESRRMGAPKALLAIGAETFAQRLARTFASLCDPVVIVTGAAPGIVAPPAREIHNPQWSDGQLTSLQTGLRAMSADVPAVFFAPVDCPLFRTTTVEALWRTLQETQAMFAIPRTGDRRGHPVLAAPAAIAELLALPTEAQARDVVHRHRERTAYVDVDDPGIFADIDTPADYERMIRA